MEKNNLKRDLNNSDWNIYNPYKRYTDTYYPSEKKAEIIILWINGEEKRVELTPHNLAILQHNNYLISLK